MDGLEMKDKSSNPEDAVQDEFDKKEIKPVSFDPEYLDYDEANPGSEDLGDDGAVAIAQPSGKLPMQQTYAAKKTVAQGMMDVALITANANQLKFILGADPSPTNRIAIVLIIFSLVLQVAVGVSLILKGRCDLKGESKLERANRINNYVVVGVFLITLLNVFIATLSDTSQNTVIPTSVK